MVVRAHSQTQTQSNALYCYVRLGASGSQSTMQPLICPQLLSDVLAVGLGLDCP